MSGPWQDLSTRSLFLAILEVASHKFPGNNYLLSLNHPTSSLPGLIRPSLNPTGHCMSESSFDSAGTRILVAASALTLALSVGATRI